MVIKRTSRNKLVVTISSDVENDGLQRLIDYIEQLEATAKSKVKQRDIDKLAGEVDRKWWTKNKRRFPIGKWS